MTLFEELDAIFPAHTHYYSVALTDMNEALEKCARVTGGNAQVINYSGQMILATQTNIGNEITWLNEIPRPEEPIVEEESIPYKKGK
jgi:hypothetical protein